MYINTIESIVLGSKIHSKYGSWEAARAAGAIRPLTSEEINNGRTSERTRRN